eukprot:INCI16350.5.p1 GENE.INCI16350.5~~INCI16350.5.p1  ORF type:complete len:812 (+),score=130.53 INCI16350.5:666-3101(+)
MVFPLQLALNATEEVASLKEFPNFKFFMTARATSNVPRFDLVPITDPGATCDDGSKNTSTSSCNRWLTQSEALGDGTTDSFAGHFSAVCYMTVRDMARLHTSIGSTRPVGLIQSAWGGTRVEAWMSAEAIDASGFASSVPQKTGPNNATVLYNAMVAPFNRVSVRAALWYQGEANADQVIAGVDQTTYYATMYQTMIADWRERKGMGDFAFGTVQLPPSVAAGTPPAKQINTGRPNIRIAEGEAGSHAGGLTDISGVAVTLDLGGKSAWGYDHPPNKNEISRRLALATLHAAYATQEPLWTGPVLENVSTTANTLTLSFSNQSVGGGMALHDVVGLNVDGTWNNCTLCCKELPPFEVHTSKDGWTQVAQNATTVTDTAVLLSPAVSVSSVTAVRYAWTDFVECVLQNDDGLVAGPFVVEVNDKHSQDSDTIAAPRGAGDLSLSPPMGFNSWNFYHCNIDENIVKSIADAMATNGMKAAGYSYINIDDCWQVERFPDGTIQPDPSRFPSGMKALADYVHSKGLKFGVYTARGSRTCQNRPGAYQHEEIDAATYCDWGLDYLKDDNCGGQNWKDVNTSWIKFRQGFDACTTKTGRNMMLSVEYCHNGDECMDWVADVANLWRTTSDVQATWESVMGNIHSQEPMYPIAGHGKAAFNDPDMLQIGDVGLSVDEQYSHMALWCIAGAPLLAGTDIVHASNETLAILSNPEVTAVNQDLGFGGAVQGHLYIPANSTHNSEVWGKRLSDGSYAVVLLNLDDTAALDISVPWTAFPGLNATLSYSVRNLWSRSDLGEFSSSFTAAKVPPHANVMIHIH